MNKQIEEIAEYFCHTCDFECGGGCELGHKIVECPIATETAKTLYNAGYRRQEDVAREIFAETIKTVGQIITRNIEGDNSLIETEVDIVHALVELKKKYGVTSD